MPSLASHPQRNTIRLQLKKTLILREMGASAFEDLERELEVAEFRKGESLVRQGATNMEQFFILDGILKRVAKDRTHSKKGPRLLPQPHAGNPVTPETAGQRIEITGGPAVLDCGKQALFHQQDRHIDQVQYLVRHRTEQHVRYRTQTARAHDDLLDFLVPDEMRDHLAAVTDADVENILDTGIIERFSRLGERLNALIVVELFGLMMDTPDRPGEWMLNVEQMQLHRLLVERRLTDHEFDRTERICRTVNCYQYPKHRLTPSAERRLLALLVLGRKINDFLVFSRFLGARGKPFTHHHH